MFSTAAPDSSFPEFRRNFFIVSGSCCFNTQTKNNTCWNRHTADVGLFPPAETCPSFISDNALCSWVDQHSDNYRLQQIREDLNVWSWDFRMKVEVSFQTDSWTTTSLIIGESLITRWWLFLPTVKCLVIDTVFCFFFTVFYSFTVFDAFFPSMQLSPSLIRLLLRPRGGSEESKSGRPRTLQRGRSLSQLPGDQDIPATICLPCPALLFWEVETFKMTQKHDQNVAVMQMWAN